jgi:hypothetical protein
MNIKFVGGVQPPNANWICMPEAEYLNMLAANLELAALNQGGVEDWTWYGASLDDYYKQFLKEEASRLVAYMSGFDINPDEFMFEDMADYYYYMTARNTP